MSLLGWVPIILLGHCIPVQVLGSGMWGPFSIPNIKAIASDNDTLQICHCICSPKSLVDCKYLGHDHFGSRSCSLLSPSEPTSLIHINLSFEMLSIDCDCHECGYLGSNWAKAFPHIASAFHHPLPSGWWKHPANLNTNYHYSLEILFLKLASAF